MSPPQHNVDVRGRLVVPEHSRLQLDRIRQVCAASAQVQPGRDGGVVDVVRVRHPIAVAVDAEAAPGGRNELHRTHRAVPDGVAV